MSHLGSLNRRSFVRRCSAALPLSGRLASRSGTESLARYAIWDVHCHIFEVNGRTPEERIAELIKFAGRTGIERIVVFMGMQFHYDPSPEQLRGANDEVLRSIRAWPNRTLGFVYLNPNHLAFSLEEFDRCVRDGPMVGVKLWMAKRCNAPDLDAIIGRAAAQKALVLQHTWLKSGGNLPGESTPHDLSELARRHPNVPFICSHAGGDWERGIREVRAAGNISIDIAGFDPTAGVVEMAVRELGAGRVVFGSDAGIRTFASQVAKVIGADVPEPARRMILGGNLRRILAPILKAKGYRV